MQHKWNNFFFFFKGRSRVKIGSHLFYTKEKPLEAVYKIMTKNHSELMYATSCLFELAIGDFYEHFVLIID